MKKKNEWLEKYGLTSRCLYELFSEFVSMIMLSKQVEPKQAKEDVISKVLPVHENEKMSLFYKKQRMRK